MKSIQSALNSWKPNPQINESIHHLRVELLRDPLIVSALQNKPNITEKVLDNSLIKLFEYKKEHQNCQECPGLQACPNMMKGYQPDITVNREALELTYHPCSLKLDEEQQKKQNQLIQSLYVPKEILQSSFESLDIDESREEACVKALDFAENVRPGEDGNGLYLYGRFGVGKTYIMGAIANRLKKRHIETFIVYTPDFFREMKQAIGDGSLQEKLEALKTSSVLILDDIGAETMSAWIRDDILGAILQHRMLEKLPTLFTSNFDYDELENHLSFSNKGGIEELKAKRIMERIRHFSRAVEVKGKNRR